MPLMKKYFVSNVLDSGDVDVDQHLYSSQDVEV